MRLLLLGGAYVYVFFFHFANRTNQTPPFPRHTFTYMEYTYIRQLNESLYLDLRHEGVHAAQRLEDGALHVARVELRPPPAPRQDGLDVGGYGWIDGGVCGYVGGCGRVGWLLVEGISCPTLFGTRSTTARHRHKKISHPPTHLLDGRGVDPQPGHVDGRLQVAVLAAAAAGAARDGSGGGGGADSGVGAGTTDGGGGRGGGRRGGGGGGGLEGGGGGGHG